MCDRKSMKLEELHLARGTYCDSLRPPYKEIDHVQIRSSWVATHSVAFLPRLVLALGLSGQTLHSWNRGPWLCAASDKEAGRSALAIPCVISGVTGLEATLVERHFGLVPLSVAHRCTDADILEQGIGSLLTSRGCRGLIEHIIQCMYYLYSPSWGAVCPSVTRCTILRIYAPPSPSRGPPRSRASRNQIVAGRSPPGR